MYIVIMAGGVGTRFWPKSRASNPKQMLKLFGNRTMLQLTYDRIANLTRNEKILVVTSITLKDQVREQLPQIPENNIIAEPFGRNTAPCIGLAGAIIQSREKEDEVMVVLPADHLIKEEAKFQSCIKSAAEYAVVDHCLITVGIKPGYPETGYGYIQKDSEVSHKQGRSVYKVKTFAEKPDYETATNFLKSGDFLWNSGMFIWSVQAIMQAFDAHQPEIFDGAQEIKKYANTKRLEQVITDVYTRLKSISIDYGVMEVASKVCVIEADFNWNDVGSWEAVYNLSDKDVNQNAVEAPESIMLDSKNNYIHSTKKIVAAVDVENLVVVETDDALLICRKDKSQNVKELVDSLRRKGMNELL